MIYWFIEGWLYLPQKINFTLTHSRTFSLIFFFLLFCRYFKYRDNFFNNRPLKIVLLANSEPCMSWTMLCKKLKKGRYDRFCLSSCMFFLICAAFFKKFTLIFYPAIQVVWYILLKSEVNSAITWRKNCFIYLLFHVQIERFQNQKPVIILAGL